MMLLYKITYSVFFWLKRMRRSKKTGVFKGLFRKLCDTYSYYFSVLLNRKYPHYFETHKVKWGLNRKPRKEEYVVSLTSFPARINYTHLAVETLLRQSFKPDAVVLYLAKEQFADGKLPEQLERLKSAGLTVKFCDDLRSHKKYYYAFRDYENANVILADDDMFYPSDMVKTLVKMHKKFPNDIIATSAQHITPTLSSPPSVWKPCDNIGDYTSRFDVQAFTGYGTLFPPHWYPEQAFDKDKIMQLAPTADDMWLKAMSIINSVATTRIKKFRAFGVEITNQNNVTLYSVNGTQGENLNDKVWTALVDEYKFTE